MDGGINECRGLSGQREYTPEEKEAYLILLHLNNLAYLLSIEAEELIMRPQPGRS